MIFVLSFFTYSLATFFPFTDGNRQPQFISSTKIVVISEAAPPGSLIQNLKSLVINQAPGDVYWFTGHETVFTVNATTGILITTQPLDRENIDLYTLNCFVSDVYEGSKREDQLILSVVVSEVNDNAPVFTVPREIFVKENATVNSTLAILNATDEDFGRNRLVFFKLQTETTYFSLMETGELKLLKPLDFELQKSYQLSITVKDKAVSPLETTDNFTITVLDVGDMKPVFTSSKYNFSVKEFTPVGASVFMFTALDGDTGVNDTINYNISSGDVSDGTMFVVNSTTGVLYVNKIVNYINTKLVRLTLKAYETSDVTFYTETSVIISIEDINDHQPVFEFPSYTFNVDENVAIETVIETAFVVTDDDFLMENKKFVYSLTWNSYFSINSSTGNLIVKQPSDYEEYKQFRLMVFATEMLSSEKHSGNATVIIAIVNLNDNTPQFVLKEYVFAIAENSTDRSLVGHVNATDSDMGEYGVFSYLLKTYTDRFSLHSKSGVLITLSQFDRETQSVFHLEIEAVDKGGLNAKTDVVVNITDVNDNSPSFENLPGKMEIEENKENVLVYTVKAVDKDTYLNAAVLYSIQYISYSPGKFSINKTSGEIFLHKALDFELIEQVTMEISAHDQGFPVLSTLANLTLKIKDVNDNRPMFNQSSYSGIIKESAHIGTSVLTVHVDDADSNNNGMVEFKLMTAEARAHFHIDLIGRISLKKMVDREAKDKYNFTVLAKDHGTPSLSSSCQVVIDVLDVNDEPPTFSNGSYHAHVNESARINASVIQLHAVDEDNGSYGDIGYVLKSGNIGEAFVINRTSGMLTVASPLDREILSRYTLTITAIDGGEPPYITDVVVEIDILDVNDNAPLFIQEKYFFNISENQSKGSYLGTVIANDTDENSSTIKNGMVVYIITDGNINNSFFIDRNSGNISTSLPLDREAVAQYHLKVVAIDGGNPSLNSSAHILVNIIDQNDNVPVFRQQEYSVSVSEDVSLGSFLIEVHATDLDENENAHVIYSLLDDKHFRISTNGSIFVNGTLDYEENNLYTVKAIATDDGLDPKMSFVDITVYVTNVNDNPPTFLNLPNNTNLLESQPAGEIFTVQVEDKDSLSNPRFSIINQTSDIFKVNATTGDIFTTRPVNRDLQTSFVVNIMANDTGSPPLVSTGTLFINILDWNTHSPHFLNMPASVRIAENSAEGLFVFKVSADDDDEGENARLKFQLSSGADGYFTINKTSGVIQTTDLPLDYETANVYTLQVSVEDHGATVLQVTSTLTVNLLDQNDNVPVFEPRFPSEVYNLNFSESIKVLTHIIDVNATDMDSGTYGEITYSISESDFFSIEPDSGVVRLMKHLDRESNLDVEFTVIARDGGEITSLNSTIKVHIMITDDNDNAPRFDEALYTSSIVEGVNEDTTVATLTATDADVGENGSVWYSIVDGNDQGFFHIPEKYIGMVTATGLLDRESFSVYNLSIMATDEGASPLNSTTQLIVRLKDINDNNPVFLKPAYYAKVRENSKRGTSVTQVSATDLDLGLFGEVGYKVVKGDTLHVFYLNESSGMLTVAGMIDREEVERFVLTIEAFDGDTPNPRKVNVELAVTVNDLNDNVPQFSETIYNGTVQENLNPGTKVEFVSEIDVTDADLGNGLRFTLVGDDSKPFIFEDGYMKSTVVFDREEQEVYNFTLNVHDGVHAANASILVRVSDVNDQRPHFSEDFYEVQVNESIRVDSVIYPALATDLDKGLNKEIIYSMRGGDEIFGINKDTGAVNVRRPLNSEIQSSFNLSLTATDKGFPSLNHTMTLMVTILDVIDSPPYFPVSNVRIEISENFPINGVVYTAIASDRDQNDVLGYALNATKEFAINSSTGEVTLRAAIDREIINQYTLTIVAKDTAGYMSNDLQLTVALSDVNDNKPLFTSPTSCRNDVTEDLANGTTLFTVSTTDNDLGSNADVRYSLSGSIAHLLQIHSVKGTVKKQGNFQSYVAEILTFSIIAFDSGTPSLSASLNCSLHVMDVNNHSPKFNQRIYLFNVSENASAGEIIGRVEAREGDKGRNALIKYSFARPIQQFYVNQSTGEIFVANNLDREVQDEYEFTITATDSGFSPRQDATIITIHITDENDMHPQFSLSKYVFSVYENTVGLVGQVSATDGDLKKNAELMYSIVPSNFQRNISEMFYVNKTNGNIVQLTPFDREINPSHELLIKATDGGVHSLSSLVNVTVVILDMNDETPVFYEKTIDDVYENTPVGTFLTTFTAVDKDSGMNGKVSYRIMSGSNDFELDAASGDLFILNQLDFETTPIYELQIEAKDHGLPSLSTNHTFRIQVININDNVPQFNQSFATGLVRENSPPGTFVARIQASDADNDAVFYFITSSTDHFNISVTEGILRTTKPLDRERKALYNVVVEATDVWRPQRKLIQRRFAEKDVSSQSITVHVIDANDNVPRFKQNLFSAGVSEEIKYGSSVLQVVAQDADLAPLHYFITSGNKGKEFRLDELTGWVVSLKSFKEKTGSVHEFSVKVVDNDAVSPYSNHTAKVKISVLTNLQRVVMTINVPLETVLERKSTYREGLTSVTGYLYNIDDVQHSTTKSGAFDFTRTDVSFHVIDPATNEILGADAVLSMIDNHYSELKKYFDEWNVTFFVGKVSRIAAPQEPANEQLKIVLSVTVCLLVIFLLFVIIACRWRQKQKRKLKAVTISAFQTDAQLMNVFPTRPTMVDDLPEIPRAFSFGETKKVTFQIPKDEPDVLPAAKSRGSLFTTFQVNEGYEKNNDDNSLTLLDAINQQALLERDDRDENPNFPLYEEIDKKSILGNVFDVDDDIEIVDDSKTVDESDDNDVVKFGDFVDASAAPIKCDGIDDNINDDDVITVDIYGKDSPSDDEKSLVKSDHSPTLAEVAMEDNIYCTKL